MSNPVWDGIEIDYDALDGYGWRVTKISIGSVDYPLFLGYQVAGLREMDSKLQGIAQGFVASSSSEMTLGLGTKSIAVQEGKGFSTGTPILVADTAAPSTRWDFGVISSYDAETGALEYEATESAGSGSGTSWSLSITGLRGPSGAGNDASKVPLDGSVAMTGNLGIERADGESNLIRMSRGNVALLEFGMDDSALSDDAGGSKPYLSVHSNDGSSSIRVYEIDRATGTVDLGGNVLSGAALRGTRFPVLDLGDVSGTVAIGVALENALRANLTGNTDFDFAPAAAGSNYTVKLRLTNAGGFLPAFLYGGSASAVRRENPAPAYASQSSGTVTRVTVDVWDDAMIVWESAEV